MKCSIKDCPGAYDRKLVIHTVRPGGELIVIDDVPALVCDTCGDVLFELDTIEQIEQVLQDGGRKPTTTAPVFHLRQAG
jgi:YgiT-type zinc finger domain-containing protein